MSVRSRPGALARHQPLVAQPAEAPGSDPGGSWFDSTRGDRQRSQLRAMRRRSMAGRPAVTRRTLVRPQPSQLRNSFLGRLTAGSSALNRRMRGSNPARGALIRTRPWRPGGLQPRAGEGSIPSVRASRPGLLADRGCRPLKPATRVRIPLGAFPPTRPWCQRQHTGVPCLRCGFDPRRPL
jgi:hypothetical protein